MYHRPWPLIIIAIMHMLEPLTKIAYFSLIQQKSPITIILNQFQQLDILHIFAFFFLFPIGGIAIYAVKHWSLWVFLGVECWAIAANFSQLHHLLETMQYGTFATIILFAAVNTAVVIYLMIPAVRVAYTDPRLRWWEAFPRYFVNYPCSYGAHRRGTILNISKGGLFIKPDNLNEQHGIIHISFIHDGKEINVYGRVIHNFTFEGEHGFGVEFHELNEEGHKSIRKLIKTLESLKVKRRPERRPIFSSFLNWAKKLPKGEGIFPEKGPRKQDKEADNKNKKAS